MGVDVGGIDSGRLRERFGYWVFVYKAESSTR